MSQVHEYKIKVVQVSIKHLRSATMQPLAENIESCCSERFGGIPLITALRNAGFFYNTHLKQPSDVYVFNEMLVKSRSN